MQVLAELEPLAVSWGAVAFAVVLGLMWGSFANVCIYRWPPSAEHPKGRSVVTPGSHCFACKAPIRWYDNLPLVSWLLLRGACRACKAKFSARYLLVEVLTGALFGVAWWMTVVAGALVAPLDERLLRFAVVAAFCFVLVVITFIDIDHKLILDKVTVPSIVVFYLLGLAIGRDWWFGLVGIAVGYGVPWIVGWIYYIVAEQEGLGLGDSMLLAVVGALLGWHGVVASLFLGALVGSVVGVIGLARKRDDSDGEPAPSRASAFVAIGAVGSTVFATIAGLRGWYVAAGIACVAALACLVISRRLEPELPDEDPAGDPSEPGANEPAPPRTPALLAMSSALLFVGAIATTLLRYPVPAIALAACGLALLLVARHLYEKGATEDAAPVSETTGTPASVLRTELPFGPFLALGALFYLFAEPWIVLQLSLL